MGQHRWASGQSGNPKGRPAGSRNRRTEDIFFRLENRGDTDPVDLLSEIVTNPNERKELRIQAAGLLVPYKYGKRGAIPEPPAPRFIGQPVRLPRATTIAQAADNIACLSELKATGQIDLDFCREPRCRQSRDPRRADRRGEVDRRPGRPARAAHHGLGRLAAVAHRRGRRHHQARARGQRSRCDRRPPGAAGAGCAFANARQPRRRSRSRRHVISGPPLAWPPFSGLKMRPAGSKAGGKASSAGGRS